MRRPRIASIVLTMAAALVAVALLAAGEQAETPGEPQPPRSEDAARSGEDSAPGAAGIRVYLDPETGEVLDRPTDPLTERLLDERLSTYSADLLEEALPDGGYRVDLRGRFQSAVVATIDPETDEVTIDCISPAPTDEAGHER